MSTGRTFDIDDSTKRTSQNVRNNVQVTLIQEQIPNLAVDDNMSETDLADDYENRIEFNHLTGYTL